MSICLKPVCLHKGECVMHDANWGGERRVSVKMILIKNCLDVPPYMAFVELEARRFLQLEEIKSDFFSK